MNKFSLLAILIMLLSSCSSEEANLTDASHSSNFRDVRLTFRTENKFTIYSDTVRVVYISSLISKFPNYPQEYFINQYFQLDFPNNIFKDSLEIVMVSSEFNAIFKFPQSQKHFVVEWEPERDGVNNFISKDINKYVLNRFRKIIFEFDVNQRFFVAKYIVNKSDFDYLRALQPQNIVHSYFPDRFIFAHNVIGSNAHWNSK